MRRPASGAWSDLGPVGPPGSASTGDAAGLWSSGRGGTGVDGVVGHVVVIEDDGESSAFRPALGLDEVHSGAPDDESLQFRHAAVYAGRGWAS